MPNPYYEAYPRSGDVVVLCEGDLVGYEVSMLRRWIDAKVGTAPLVDIWPCGTANSIFGLSDAVGRARPLLAIEDRDFRTIAEADADVSERKKDRQRRDVRVLGWQTWRRAEIENYFLDPDILLPVMSDAFACTPDDVKAAVTEVLPALVPYQVFQYVLYRVRRTWSSTDPSPLLPYNVQLTPVWRDDGKTIAPPEFDSAVQQLETNLRQWSATMSKACVASSEDKIPGFLQSLHETRETWEQVDWDDSTWKNDWAGKDILKWIRIILTSRFGWPDLTTKGRKILSWQNLNRSKRDAQDRPSEMTLKPMLVRQFLERLANEATGDLYDEWNAIVQQIRQPLTS